MTTAQIPQKEYIRRSLSEQYVKCDVHTSESLLAAFGQWQKERERSLAADARILDDKQNALDKDS